MKKILFVVLASVCFAVLGCRMETGPEYPRDIYNLIGGEWVHEDGKVKFEIYDQKLTQFSYRARIVPEDGRTYSWENGHSTSGEINLNNDHLTLGYRRDNDFGSSNGFSLEWINPNEIFLIRSPEIDYSKPDWENQRGSANPTIPGGTYRRK